MTAEKLLHVLAVYPTVQKTVLKVQLGRFLVLLWVF